MTTEMRRNICLLAKVLCDLLKENSTYLPAPKVKWNIRSHKSPL